MAKLIILSILIVSMAVPIRLATAANPQRALRRVQGIVVVFVVVWGYMCLHVYPSLVELK